VSAYVRVCLRVCACVFVLFMRVLRARVCVCVCVRGCVGASVGGCAYV